MVARRTDVVIIGAGAAGLMCGLVAGGRGRRVTILEHNAEPGRKILISGGGRCNFTNLNARPDHFLSANPHFAKSALARYTPHDFLELVERHRIPWHEKAAGQLFCDRSARDILGMLLGECASADVSIETACSVHAVRSGFAVETSHGVVESSALVIATGGLSIPKMGASPFGYRLAQQFGLKIVECRAALVPLVFSKEDLARFDGLAGVATESRVCAGGQSFQGRLLFTHRGLSGPAVLQASSYWRPGEEAVIDLIPDIDLRGELRDLRSAGSRAEVRTVAAKYLPKRLAERWFDLHHPGKPLLLLSDREIDAIADDLHRWGLYPAGTEGYEKAEVTAGGVDTAELSSKTMEAKKVSGLFFIGEVVDVTGQLGGFNFQWAWASGNAAGLAV